MIRPVPQKPIRLSGEPPTQRAPRDDKGNIDIDALHRRHIELCMNPACYRVMPHETAQHAWLFVRRGQHLTLTFCSWGCLRDYCNTTVIDTYP